MGSVIPRVGKFLIFCSSSSDPQSLITFDIDV